MDEEKIYINTFIVCLTDDLHRLRVLRFHAGQLQFAGRDELIHRLSHLISIIDEQITELKTILAPTPESEPER